MKKLIIPILAIMALAACNKSEVVPAAQENGKAIRFTSNLPTYTITKAASVLDGKTVNIFAGAPINATTTAEADDSKLTPATTLHWIKDQTETTTFASVYPADVATGMSFEYTVTEDLEYHGAVLAATAKDVEPEETVNFVYKHPFAMLKIAVSNNLEGSPAITGVSVENTYASATFDLAAETVTTSGDKVAIPATLADGKYNVVLIPQSAKPIIKVNIGGDAPKTYKFVITSDVDFAANKYYNVALTLDDSTPPVVEGEEVVFGFTVAEWEAAEDDISIVNVTDKWSLIGIGGDWDNDVDMTLVNGLWTATGVEYQAGDEFKLRKEHDWSVNAGLKAGVSYVGDQAWDGYLEANSDYNIKLAAAGTYTLTFNPENYLFTASKTGDAPEPPAPVVYPWKVVGTMNEWTYADGIEMTETEGIWECDITYAEGDAFKLFDNTTWAGLKEGWKYYGTGEFDDGYLWTDGSAGNIYIGAEGGIAGNYHLAFNSSTLRLIITEIVPEP